MSSTATKMMCGNKDHFKNFSFCQECVKDGCTLEKVFFCSQCQKDKRKVHNAHSDQVQNVNNKNFQETLAQTKKVIMQEMQTIKTRSQKQGNQQKYAQIMNLLKSKLQFMKLIDQKQSFVDLILNYNVIKWLVQIKFWQGKNRSSIIQFQNRIKKIIQKQIVEADKSIEKIIKNVVHVYVHQKFSVDLTPNKVGDILESQINNQSKEINHRKRQTEIFNLVIKHFTSLNCKQCQQTEKQCQKLLQRYPDSKIVYLILIRVFQLLPGKNMQIPKILQQIVKNVDSQFDKTDIFYYYSAMAQWQMTDKPEKNNHSIFFELKNKKFYKLVNVDAYINALNKAIAIRQKPVYYTSLGLGYIVKENYEQAVRVFKLATQLLTSRNDAVDLNKFWAEIKLDGQEVEFETIMQNLETRTLQFIINICKYFKKSYHFQELVQCCEELIIRQPQNQNFKIQFVKSILYFSSNLSHFDEEDDQKLLRAELMIIDLKRAQQIEASKLQKRLTRVKARHQYKNNNFMKASETYQILTKGTKLTTASDYYNHAASVFKLFLDQQCTDDSQLKQAYQSILKALGKKPDSIKYKKLKFFVCSYMNLFNQANAVYEDLKKSSPNTINQNEYKTLIQYVKDNMEDERYLTPGRSS